jgi:hypothetical protein
MTHPTLSTSRNCCWSTRYGEPICYAGCCRPTTIDGFLDIGFTRNFASSQAWLDLRKRKTSPTMWPYRGRVLSDLAVAIADGASAITDLRVLADQPGLFGEVASVPTAWRSLAAVDADALARIATASGRTCSPGRVRRPPPP